MLTTAAVAVLLAGCSGLTTADDPAPATTPADRTAAPSPTGPGPASPGPTAEPATSDPATSDAPSGGGTPLPVGYPWEPRQTPPPGLDADDAGEPWVGGFDTVVLPEHLEIAHDGPATYSVTGIEIYEHGPDQSRAVISYEGGQGLAGLDLSVVGATDFPPEVTLPGGVDTGLAFVTGAQAPLGGGLEPGQLVEPEQPSRIHGVSVGPPDTTLGTGIYVGLDEGAVLWAVVDHPGTLVLVVTDPGTGPTA